MSRIGVSTPVRTLEPTVIADLDTLLTTLYMELTDRIIPSGSFARRGPGKPPDVTDAGLACLAVAQVLLRFDDERRSLRAARKLVGHLFPGCSASQSTTSGSRRSRRLEAALRRLADRMRDRGDAAADGRHPGPVRDLCGDRQALWPVRLGRVWLLSQPFPLVLGRRLLLMCTSTGP